MDRPKILRPNEAQRFPFIALPKALERVRELYKVAGQHDVPVTTALKAWGYSEKSSGGLMTVAALKLFGLADDVGSGSSRKIVLTETALKIIRDPRQQSPERDELVRQAAMAPPIHYGIHEKYSGLPPSEEALKAHLLMELGMRDDAADDFAREFNATMAFAGIIGSDTIQDMDGGLQGEPQEPIGRAGLPSHSVSGQPMEMRHRMISPTPASNFGAGQVSLTPTGENDIKVLLDGDHLRIAAWVDRAGLQRLKKILAAHELLLADEEPVATENMNRNLGGEN